LLGVIFPIAIDMFKLKWHALRRRIAFAPSTTLALFAVQFDKMPAQGPIRKVRRRQFAGSPFRDHCTPVVFVLTALRAIHQALAADRLSALIQAKNILPTIHL
jgi:hypothetical protein